MYGLRQFRKTQTQDRRRRRRGSAAGGASEPTPGVPSITSAGPRRPVRRRRPSLQSDAAYSPRIKRQEQGKNSSSSSVGRTSRSPTTAVCFGRSVEASGSLSGGGGGVTGRSVDGGANSGVEGQPTRDQTVEVKAETLQRALANMRSKARTLRFEERDGICSCVPLRTFICGLCLTPIGR